MAGINLRRTLFGGNDIAIDLGTANTLIYVKGAGVVVDEPTLLAIQKSDRSIFTYGEEAKKLVGRVPDSIELVKPLRDGVISEIEYAEELVKTLLSKAIGRSYSRPRIIICVPNGVTSVDQRSIETAAHATGASEVFTIEEPMAAAIGANLQIFEPFGKNQINEPNVTRGVEIELSQIQKSSSFCYWNFSSWYNEISRVSRFGHLLFSIFCRGAHNATKGFKIESSQIQK